MPGRGNYKFVSEAKGFDSSRIENGFLIVKYDTAKDASFYTKDSNYFVKVGQYIVILLKAYDLSGNKNEVLDAILKELKDRRGKNHFQEFVLFPPDENHERSTNDHASFMDSLGKLRTHSIPYIDKKNTARKEMYEYVCNFFSEMDITPDASNNYPINYPITKKIADRVAWWNSNKIDNNLLWRTLEGWYGGESTAMEIDPSSQPTQPNLSEEAEELAFKEENQQTVEEFLKSLDVENFFDINTNENPFYQETSPSNLQTSPFDLEETSSFNLEKTLPSNLNQIDFSERKKNPNEQDGFEKYKDTVERNLNNLQEKVFELAKNLFKVDDQAANKEVDILYMLKEIWPKVADELQKLLHNEKLSNSTTAKIFLEYQLNYEKTHKKEYSKNNSKKQSKIHTQILEKCIKGLIEAAKKAGRPIVPPQSSTVPDKHKLSVNYRSGEEKLKGEKWHTNYASTGPRISKPDRVNSMSYEEQLKMLENKWQVMTKIGSANSETLRNIESKGHLSSDLDNDPTLQKALMDAFMTALDKMFDQMDKDKSEWVITLDLNDEKLAKLNKEEIRKFLNTKTHDYQFSLPCEKPSSNTAIVTVSAEYIPIAIEDAKYGAVN